MHNRPSCVASLEVVSALQAKILPASYPHFQTPPCALIKSNEVGEYVEESKNEDCLSLWSGEDSVALSHNVHLAIPRSNSQELFRTELEYIVGEKTILSWERFVACR